MVVFVSIHPFFQIKSQKGGEGGCDSESHKLGFHGKKLIFRPLVDLLVVGFVVVVVVVGFFLSGSFKDKEQTKAHRRRRTMNLKYE